MSRVDFAKEAYRPWSQIYCMEGLSRHSNGSLLLSYRVEVGFFLPHVPVCIRCWWSLDTTQHLSWIILTVYKEIHLVLLQTHINDTDKHKSWSAPGCCWGWSWAPKREKFFPSLKKLCLVEDATK